MKKLLLSSLMLTAGLNLSAMVYIPVPVQNTQQALYAPAAGPLVIGDRVNPQTGILERGVIMYTLFTNPLFAAELATITQFNGQAINNVSYQTIMDNLAKTTNTAQATATVKAFEKVIMYLYDYRAYAYGNYKPGTSIFVTGIKWSWINPLAYFDPKSYISDNNPELHQLIDELSNLSSVAKKHSVKDGIRLELTVHSYRNWRRNLIIATAACAATGLYVKTKLMKSSTQA
ncbi:MAG: hypothetical protein WC747_00690 [Candidatus Babeliales bacterium]|jgi:hypothetical protein